jgi:DNA-binding protein YbaB
VKQAIGQAKEESAAEMGKLTAGLGLPPGMGF